MKPAIDCTINLVECYVLFPYCHVLKINKYFKILLSCWSKYRFWFGSSLKVAFFRKWDSFFKSSKIIPNHYLQLEIWINGLLLWAEFQVQDSDLKYFSWRFGHLKNKSNSLKNATFKGEIKPISKLASRRFSKKMSGRIWFVCREEQKSRQNKFVCLFFGRC